MEECHGWDLLEKVDEENAEGDEEYSSLKDPLLRSAPPDDDIRTRAIWVFTLSSHRLTLSSSSANFPAILRNIAEDGSICHDPTLAPHS